MFISSSAASVAVICIAVFVCSWISVKLCSALTAIQKSCKKIWIFCVGIATSCCLFDCICTIPQTFRNYCRTTVFNSDYFIIRLVFVIVYLIVSVSLASFIEYESTFVSFVTNEVIQTVFAEWISLFRETLNKSACRAIYKWWS